LAEAYRNGLASIGGDKIIICVDVEIGAPRASGLRSVGAIGSGWSQRLTFDLDRSRVIVNREANTKNTGHCRKKGKSHVLQRGHDEEWM